MYYISSIFQYLGMHFIIKFLLKYFITYYIQVYKNLSAINNEMINMMIFKVKIFWECNLIIDIPVYFLEWFTTQVTS